MKKYFIVLGLLSVFISLESSNGCRGIQRDQYSTKFRSLSPQPLRYRCACPCNKISGPDGLCRGCNHTGDAHRGLAHTRRSRGDIHDHSGVFKLLVQK